MTVPRRRVRAPAVLLPAMLVVLLTACAGDEDTPEAQVRRTLLQLEQAVEARQPRDLEPLLAETYRDRYHPNRGAAIRSLAAYVRRHRQIHLFTLIDAVTLDASAGSANAVVYVAMTGVPATSAEALVAVNADLYRFDIALQADGTHWTVSGSDWRPVDIGILRGK